MLHRGQGLIELYTKTVINIKGIDRFFVIVFFNPMNGSSRGEMLKVKEGLGGWLIVVGIGLCVSPIQSFLEFGVFKQMFSDGTWEAFTLQSSEFYNPLFGVLICFEFIFSCIFFIAYTSLIFLFFKKKQIFPKIFIITLLANFAFIIIDALVRKVVFPTEPAFDEDTRKNAFQKAVQCAIWIPYMIKSVRVKNTFVN